MFVDTDPSRFGVNFAAQIGIWGHYGRKGVPACMVVATVFDA